MRTPLSYSREDSWMFTSVASYKFVLARGKSVRLSFSRRCKSLDLRLPTLHIYLLRSRACEFTTSDPTRMYIPETHKCVISLDSTLGNWRITIDQSLYAHECLFKTFYARYLKADLITSFTNAVDPRGNAKDCIFFAKDDALSRIVCLLQILCILHHLASSKWNGRLLRPTRSVIACTYVCYARLIRI